MTPLDELKMSLDISVRSPARHILTCAFDVHEVIADEYPASPPELPEVPDMSSTFVPLRPLAMLTGTDIVIDKAWERGRWELIRHDSCRVIGNEVSHAQCMRVAEGWLA